MCSSLFFRLFFSLSSDFFCVSFSPPFALTILSNIDLLVVLLLLFVFLLVLLFLLRLLPFLLLPLLLFLRSEYLDFWILRYLDFCFDEFSISRCF